MLELVQNLIHVLVMKKVQKLAHQVLKRQTETVRFSVTLTETDNLRLENLAELMGRSKSAFCSDLIAAALDDIEEEIDIPEGTDMAENNLNLNLPSSEEYTEALNSIKIKLTNGHRAMLTAHYHAPEYTMTTPALAKVAGYENYGAVNLQYGRLGRMLADSLNYPLPKHGSGSPFPTAFLVKWRFEEIWYCTLHPQVVEALELSGLTKG